MLGEWNYGCSLSAFVWWYFLIFPEISVYYFVIRKHKKTLKIIWLDVFVPISYLLLDNYFAINSILLRYLLDLTNAFLNI